jgi:hypothetical protein
MAAPVLTRILMSTTGLSRKSTLQDVFEAIEADLTLAKRRRQDLLSALKTASRVLEASLASLPCDTRQLGPRLANVAPAGYGLSDRSWANCRALVANGVARAHPLLPRRQKEALAPAWEELVGALQP